MSMSLITILFTDKEYLSTIGLFNNGKKLRLHVTCPCFLYFHLSIEAIFIPAKINMLPAKRFINLMMIGLIPTLVDLYPK